MKRGRHAADDGSFARSSGMAVGRAVALLAVAVLIGTVLLDAADDSPSRRVSTGGHTTTTTPPVEGTTTTAVLTPTTLAARPPKDVKVLSANGTDVKGAAGKATEALRAAGFNVLAPVDVGRSVPDTSVYFVADFEREAQVVASLLGLGNEVVKALPTPSPVRDLRGANVVVVIGPETAARLAGASPKAGTPTTGTQAPTSTAAPAKT